MKVLWCQSDGQEVTCFHLFCQHMLLSIPRILLLTLHHDSIDVQLLLVQNSTSHVPGHNAWKQLFRINPIHSPATHLAPTGAQSTDSSQPMTSQPTTVYLRPVNGPESCFR